MTAASPPLPRVYLAGPDVFFRDSARHFDRLEALCLEYGLQGCRPTEGAPQPGLRRCEGIYQANVELIQRCDAVLANLMPFRNPLEPDSGTVFEVGMAVALGKPVAGVVPGTPNGAHTYESRVLTHCGPGHRDSTGALFDSQYGFMVEEFGHPLNLMLACSTPLFTSTALALACLSARLRGQNKIA